jgi:hypothetical protein
VYLGRRQQIIRNEISFHTLKLPWLEFNGRMSTELVLIFERDILQSRDVVLSPKQGR